MDDQADTHELREAQRRRELDERERAHQAGEDPDGAQHERRADKARYLREKLEERAAAEEGADAGPQ